MPVWWRRSRREPSESFGPVVPLGTWCPDGYSPLVLESRQGTGPGLALGSGIVVFGLFLAAWSGRFGPHEGDPLDEPAARLTGVLVGAVIVAVGVFCLVAFYYARKGTTIVDRHGITYQRKAAVKLRASIESVRWDELAQVGVCLKTTRKVKRAGGLLRTTDTTVCVRLGLQPRADSFGGRKLPSFFPWFVRPPYTHGVGVPQPGPRCDGRHIPVVRDLEAALRHFAPEIYAGIDEDATERDHTKQPVTTQRIVVYERHDDVSAAGRREVTPPPAATTREAGDDLLWL